MHVHGLHESESRHDQHEEQRDPFLELRAIGLGIFLHNGTTSRTIPKLDVHVEAGEAKNSALWRGQ